MYGINHQNEKGYVALYACLKLFNEYAIIRDCLTAFWLLPSVSTRDPIISPRALAQGLIMVKG